MAELTDEQLVASFNRTGDQQLLAILVQRHLDPMFNFVYKYTHDFAEAEDVAQEAFVKIWKNLKKFNHRYKFKTWAYTIAKNTALDFLKRKNLVPFSDLENQTEGKSYLKSLVSREPLPLETLEKLDDLQMIRLASNKLPPIYQQILALYYGQDLNFREISALLKQSINTVKTRHRRAIVYLKNELFK
jgi:RNA polymerase sigma-70 factor (ECF subfamily)